MKNSPADKIDRDPDISMTISSFLKTKTDEESTITAKFEERTLPLNTTTNIGFFEWLLSGIKKTPEFKVFEKRCCVTMQETDIKRVIKKLLTIDLLEFITLDAYMQKNLSLLLKDFVFYKFGTLARKEEEEKRIHSSEYVREYVQYLRKQKVERSQISMNKTEGAETRKSKHDIKIAKNKSE